MRRRRKLTEDQRYRIEQAVEVGVAKTIAGDRVDQLRDLVDNAPAISDERIAEAHAHKHLDGLAGISVDHRPGNWNQL